MSAHLIKIFALQRFVLWLPVLAVVLIESSRVLLVHQFFARSASEHVFFVGMTVKHDATIVGLILLFQMVGLSAWRPVALLGRVAALGIMVLSVVDLFVFAQFARRLRLSDLVLYGAEGHAISDILYGFCQDISNVPLLAAALLLLVSTVMVGVKPIPVRLRVRLLSSLTAVGLVACSSVPDMKSYNNAWAYNNFVEIQLMNGVLKDYSPEAIAAAKDWSEARDANIQCVPGLASRRNVTLVIWESLASHRSHFLSGLDNWTPAFDALARQHHIWNNFFANGNNTAWGYVASLTGHDPLLALNGKNFQRWWGVALPFRVKDAGYKTAFLTTGDNGFLEVGAWMKSIGFDDVEGHDAPFYNGMERFNFRAAPDGALYDRSLQWIAKEKSPFVLVLKTVSTHQPYMHPYTRERSEEAAFRYADEALGKYVQDLTTQGYFEGGGVLMVTGDHRDMVTLGPDEASRFGKAADSMVPLLVIGKDLPVARQIVEPFQQADITPSIEYLVSDKACFAPRQRNLFQTREPVKPRCIFHMRGDEFDEVDVFCGDQYGTVKLDGDATRLTEGRVWNASSLIHEINAERIGWFLRRKPDGRMVWALPFGQSESRS